MPTTRSDVSTWAQLESLAKPRTRQVIGVVSFAVLTALAARVALPIPGTAVPFTFQPLAVLLTGALLGARLGAASQLLYLSAGMFGLPVFVGGAGVAYLLGPTGGYLIAYPLAAAAVGALTGGSRLRNVAGMLAGLAVIYAGGVAWLAILQGWSAAVMLGLTPFLAADLVKAAVALIVSGRLRDQCHTLFRV